jgi:ComF family protein
MLRGNKQCGGCLAREQSFYFQNRSCVCYSNLVKRVVQLYKYKGKEDLFIPLASWMLSVLLSEFGQFSWDFLTWVPMDSYRLQERGFNQARMLALYLGQAIKKPAKGFLVRKKPSLPQSLLKRKKRLLISKGVFALSEYANSDVLQGKKIIIVDDVYTTGATLISCASLLLESGSKQVCSITFAR